MPMLEEGVVLRITPKDMCELVEDALNRRVFAAGTVRMRVTEVYKRNGKFSVKCEPAHDEPEVDRPYSVEPVGVAK